MSRTLTRIRATNLAGSLNLDADTAGVVYFRGRNGSGKSLALACIDLALIGPSAGRWPKLGKPPGPFNVELTLDTDGARHTVARGWTGKGNTCTIDGRAPDDAATEIAALLGGRPGRESPTRTGRFDLSAFLALSGPARAAWLAANVFAGAWTADDLREELATRGLDRAEAESNAREDAQADTATRSALTVLAGARGPTEEHAALVQVIAARLADLTRRLEVLKGAAEADAEDAMADASLPPGSVAHYEQEASVARAQLANLDARLSTARAANARRADVEREIEALIRSCADAEARADALAKAADAAQAEVDAAVTPIADARAEQARRTDQLAGARARQSAVSEVVARRQSELALARVEADASEGAAGFAERRLRAVAEEREDRSTLAKLRDAVVDLSEVVGRSPSTTGAQAALARAGEALALVKAKPTKEELDACTEEAERKRGLADVDRATAATAKQLFESAERAQTDARTATFMAERAETEARQAADRLEEAANGKKARIVSNRDGAGRERADAAMRRERADGLRADLDTLAVSDTGADEQQRGALMESVAQAERAAGKLRDAEALQRNAELRVERLSGLQSAADRWRGYRGAAAAARDALMARERNPIAELANVTLSEVIGREVVIDKGDVRVRVVDGSKMPAPGGAGAVYDLDAASNAEAAIVGAVLTAALQSHLGGWRVIVVDELAVIETELRAAFVAALVKMQAAGTLDNVLLAGWDACDAPGVRVYTLTE